MSDSKESKDKRKKPMTAKEKYNAVTDTVTGANVRLLDNLLQAAAVLIFVILGSLIGWFFGGGTGALVGVLGGLVLGVLISGLFLMIYRAVKHAKGEHD